jgi:hypothetical protein
VLEGLGAHHSIAYGLKGLCLLIVIEKSDAVKLLSIICSPQNIEDVMDGLLVAMVALGKVQSDRDQSVVTLGISRRRKVPS